MCSEQPLRPARAHVAVILDQRNVRGLAAKMPAARSSGTVIGSSNESSLTVGQRRCDERARRLVRPVGDHDLRFGSVALERLEACRQVREPVDGGDDDGELGPAHGRRSTSRWPAASAKAQTTLNADDARQREQRAAAVASLGEHPRQHPVGHQRTGTTGAATTPTRLRARLKCRPRWWP